MILRYPVRWRSLQSLVNPNVPHCDECSLCQSNNTVSSQSNDSNMEQLFAESSSSASARQISRLATAPVKRDRSPSFKADREDGIDGAEDDSLPELDEVRAASFGRGGTDDLCLAVPFIADGGRGRSVLYRIGGKR